MSNQLPITENEKILPAGEAILKSIEEADLVNIPSEILEGQIDALLKDGLAKEIPIVNTIVSLAKLGIGISHLLFLRKIMSFLKEFKSTTREERQQIVEKLNRSPKQRRKISEQLLLAIDRLDQFEKSEMLARIFKSYLKEEIGDFEFNKLRSALDRINLIDIPLLVEFYSGKRSRSIERDSNLTDLANIGLISIEYSNMAIGDILPDPDYAQNKLGKLFITVALAK